MQETFLTVEDAAARLKVTPYTMRKWLRVGRVGGVKMGNMWRVPERALSALAESATTLRPIILADSSAPENEGLPTE